MTFIRIIFINNSEITVFDFDDSIYGWFSLDIAIATTHAVWWGVHAEDRVTKSRFAQQFLHEFLMGYEKEHQLSEFWKQTIPCLWSIEIFVLTSGG